MEIDHILERMGKVFGFEVNVVIKKKHLDKVAWTKGMQDLGRLVNWDQYQSVVASSTHSRLPEELQERYSKGIFTVDDGQMSINNDKTGRWILLLPLYDVNNKAIAEMQIAESTAFNAGIVIFFLGLMLIIFFSWQAKRMRYLLEKDEAQLKLLATSDSLTGLATRRVFDQELTIELDRAERFEHPVSLLIIDIDHFKNVNDSYGHPVGDEVLKQLSWRLKKQARSLDKLCRYGGEEIAVILPETDPDQAVSYALRIQKAITALPFKITSDLSLAIKVSIGASTFPAHANTEILLIATADEALYTAKSNGRNRVVLYDESDEVRDQP